MQWMRMTAMMAVVLVALSGAAGCDSKGGEGPAERAGKAIDKAVDDADDKLKEVAEDTKDAVKDAAEDVKEEVKDAINK